MSVNKIRVSQIAGKRSTQGLGIESVPESILNPSRLQAGLAEGFPTDQQPISIEERKSRTPVRSFQAGTSRDDSGIVQLDGNRGHVSHPGSVDGVA